MKLNKSNSEVKGCPNKIKSIFINICIFKYIPVCKEIKMMTSRSLVSSEAQKGKKARPKGSRVARRPKTSPKCAMQRARGPVKRLWGMQRGPGLEGRPEISPRSAPERQGVTREGSRRERERSGASYKAQQKGMGTTKGAYEYTFMYINLYIFIYIYILYILYMYIYIYLSIYLYIHIHIYIIYYYIIFI